MAKHVHIYVGKTHDSTPSGAEEALRGIRHSASEIHRLMAATKPDNRQLFMKLNRVVEHLIAAERELTA